MNFGDKVFVVTTDKIVEARIRNTISHKGVVTGYEVTSPELQSAPLAAKVNKKNVFTDEEDAKKALFLKKLKKEEEEKGPAEDTIGDRHWIPGFNSRRRPRR